MHCQLIKLIHKMSPFLTGILLLASALAVVSSSEQRSTPQFITSKKEINTRDAGSRFQRSSYLYKAPSPYQSPGRPVLNSFIVTSRPLDISKEAHRRVDPIEDSPSEPPHEYKYLPQFKIECDSRRGSCSETITVPPSSTASPTFKPYTTEMIDRFMQGLEKDGKRNGGGDDLRKEDGYFPSQSSDELQIAKGSKATFWQRPSPYWPPDDDKKGWVALDPVPWSSSKISKWTADKHNPGSRPPEATRRPAVVQISHYPPSSHNQGSYTWHGPNKPSRPHDSFQSVSSRDPLIITDGADPKWPSTHNHERPRPVDRWQEDRPNYRPTSQNDYHSSYPSFNNRPQSWASNHHYEKPVHRRPQHYPTPVVYQDDPPEKEHSYGGQEDGRWVLFSDTKEYKPIADRSSFGRSLDARAKSLAKKASGKRTVKLLVLPSQGNMTTSHGGMIEVDGSSDTVDEDRRKRQLMLANKTEGDGESENTAPVVIRTGAQSVGRGKAADRSSAVIAAVGAGMVPATMAAILPIMLSQRSRRSVRFSPKEMPSEAYRIPKRRINLKTFKS